MKKIREVSKVMGVVFLLSIMLIGSNKAFAITNIACGKTYSGKVSYYQTKCYRFKIKKSNTLIRITGTGIKNVRHIWLFDGNNVRGDEISYSGRTSWKRSGNSYTYVNRYLRKGTYVLGFEAGLSAAKYTMKVTEYPMQYVCIKNVTSKYIYYYPVKLKGEVGVISGGLKKMKLSNTLYYLFAKDEGAASEAVRSTKSKLKTKIAKAKKYNGKGFYCSMSVKSGKCALVYEEYWP